MKIILTGFMGSGKTSVSKALSKLLMLPILEMDDLVCHELKVNTVNDVFSRGGEALWRETEAAIAQKHTKAKNIIISTGGGVIMNKTAINFLIDEQAVVFFLHAKFCTLEKRLAHDSSRPLFAKATHAKFLYEQRYPLYVNYADHTINTEKKSIIEIAHEIASLKNEKALQR